MVRHHRAHPRSTLPVPLGSMLSQLEKGAIFRALAKGERESAHGRRHAWAGWKNPLSLSGSISVSLRSIWPCFSAFYPSTISKRPEFSRHIFYIWSIRSFLSFFCLLSLYHIKTTRIF